MFSIAAFLALLSLPKELIPISRAPAVRKDDLRFNFSVRDSETQKQKTLYTFLEGVGQRLEAHHPPEILRVKVKSTSNKRLTQSHCPTPGHSRHSFFTSGQSMELKISPLKQS